MHFDSANLKTVEDLRLRIAATVGVPSQYLKLLLDGNVLIDDQEIHDCHLQEANIFVVREPDDLKHPSADFRVRSVKLYEDLGEAAAVHANRVAELLNDDTPVVQIAAVTALTRIGVANAYMDKLVALMYSAVTCEIIYTLLRAENSRHIVIDHLTPCAYHVPIIKACLLDESLDVRIAACKLVGCGEAGLAVAKSVVTCLSDSSKKPASKEAVQASTDAILRLIKDHGFLSLTLNRIANEVGGDPELAEDLFLQTLQETGRDVKYVESQLALLARGYPQYVDEPVQMVWARAQSLKRLQIDKWQECMRNWYDQQIANKKRSLDCDFNEKWSKTSDDDEDMFNDKKSKSRKQKAMSTKTARRCKGRFLIRVLQKRSSMHTENGLTDEQRRECN